MAFVLLISFTACEDEAEKETVAIKDRVMQIVDHVNNNDIAAFQDMCDSENTEAGDITDRSWNDLRDLVIGSSDSFSLSNIQTNESGTATAVDQNDYNHTFKFVKSGDTWLLSEWDVADIPQYYKKARKLY